MDLARCRQVGPLRATSHPLRHALAWIQRLLGGLCPVSAGNVPASFVPGNRRHCDSIHNVCWGGGLPDLRELHARETCFGDMDPQSETSSQGSVK